MTAPSGRRRHVEPVRELDPEPVRRFIERFALNLSDAGMPRMPARVFAAVLVADDGRRTAAELAELLHVSPAAVSGAVRYLMQLRMLTRAREPGERRDHYRLDSDTWYAAFARRDEIVARWVRDLEEGVEAVGPDTPAGERLEDTRQFFQFLHVELVELMDKWWRRRPDGVP